MDHDYLLLNHLCPSCRGLFLTVDNLRALLSANGLRHYTPDNYGRGGRPSCQLCAALDHGRFQNHHGCLPHEPHYLRAVLGPELADTVSQVNDDYPREIYRIISLGLVGKSEDDFEVRLYSGPLTSPAFLYLSPLTTHMGSHQLLEQARKRILDCKRNHANCPGEVTTQLPTRVIDIAESKFRLHISNPCDRGSYAALSYCWGTSQQLRTTSDTILDFEKAIPIAQLPQTIADAVEVTRRLQIRYLWVDVLCILQDSPLDMETEICAMGTIYKNATVTIAATSSKTAFEGFLGPVRHVEQATFPVTLPGPEICAICLVAPQSVAYPGTYPASHLSYVPPFALDTRGWTLQESLLSPRLLQFGLGEVLWQCQTHHMTPLSLGTRKYFTPIGGIGFPGRLPSSVFGIQVAETNTNVTSRDFWSSFIFNYSRRNVTIVYDRWNAVVGVISELSKVWRDECVAGHWKNFMLDHLLWKVVNPHKHPKAPSSEPIAPSWSWMATSKHVFVEPIDFDAEVLKSGPITPVETFPRAYLIIRALAIRLRDLRTLLPETLRLLSYQLDFLDMYPDFESEWNHVHEQALWESKKAWSKDYLLILIGSKPPEPRYGLAGLILLKDVDGLTSRIGWWECSTYSFGDRQGMLGPDEIQDIQVLLKRAPRETFAII